MECEGADLAFGCEDGSCCITYVVGLNSGTSSGGDRMQEHHPACDPTILEAREGVDLKLG